MRRWAGLEPKVGDRIELRVVDASLACALYQGIPAARLLARVRLAQDAQQPPFPWDERIAALLSPGSADFERVRRAVGRHGRVALDEGPLQATERTVAVLAWAVASDPSSGGGVDKSISAGSDGSLAEITSSSAERVACSPQTLTACAAYEPRLAAASLDKRAPAFEACVRLATRARLGPLAWERVRAIAAQLERAEFGVKLLSRADGSIFPRGVDDDIAPGDRQMVAVDRARLEGLVARDPRQLGAAIWRTEQAAGGTNVRLATFLADLSRLLAHEGSLVAAVLPPEPFEDDPGDPRPGTTSWIPVDWTAETATALADALESGATTFARVRTAASRGGDAALDALGAEMLRANAHPFASAAFAELVAKSARPRDVVRLVTYFAIAPDPGLAARALGSCAASELPRVLGAWLEAMLPQDGEDAPETSAAARVSACIASLKPYPQLYSAVQGLLPRLSSA